MKISVRAARINANLTQEEAAAALELSLNSYGRKERGENRFYADELARLSSLFNIPYDCFSEASCPQVVYANKESEVMK